MSSYGSNDHERASQQCALAIHAILCFFFVLFLVIGLPLLFLGCNPDLDNMCLNHNLVRGTAYEYRMEAQTCQECTSEACGENTCTTCGVAYPCYRGYVGLYYNGPDHKCVYTYHRRYGSEEIAMENLLADYPLNSTHNFILRKRDVLDVCADFRVGRSQWTWGVVLLCFSTVALIFLIVHQYSNHRELMAAIFPAYNVPTYNAPNNNTTSDPHFNSTSNPSPYTPVSSGVEMVCVSPDAPYPPVGQTNMNNYTATVTPYPTGSHGSSTFSHTSTTNNSPYNPYYTPHAIVATPAAPAYTPVVAYPAAVSVPYAAGVVQPTATLQASSAYTKRYDMY